MAKDLQAAEPNAEIRADELQKLKRHEPPRTPWVVVLSAGFVILAVGLGLSARQLGGVAGKLEWSRAKGGIMLAGVGAVLWLVAVWRA
jgi:hypothetical protein